MTLNTTSRAADSFLSSISGAFRQAAERLPGVGMGFCRALPARPRTDASWMESAMSWTDDRVELLKKLLADGLSASQIAAQLGGITRNAVIGKVHRLGLSGRAKSPSSSAPRPRKTRAPSHVFRSIRASMRGNTALATHAVAAYETEIEPEPEPIENVIPIGQRCSILELTEDKCHWPIGDPGQSDFFFCGGKTLISLPYCGYHSRIAYQPANDRRRDRRPMRV
jgi:GcrA cell cycle regulator